MPAAKKAQQYSAHELADRLAKKYAAPQYAFLEQVRNGTGGFANRSADAMALSLWPSRGLMLDGFEIKGYRTDWLRELKNPAKAEELAVYCNRWWIVGSTDIVKLEEVPDNWGWLAPHGTGLKVMKPAPLLEGARELDRVFIAALLRNVTEHMVHERHVDERVRERGESLAQHKVEKLQDQIAAATALAKKVLAFEEASGVKIDQWAHTPEKIGKVVQMVLQGHHLQLNDDVVRLRARLVGLLTEVDKVIADVGVTTETTA